MERPPSEAGAARQGRGPGSKPTRPATPRDGRSNLRTPDIGPAPDSPDPARKAVAGTSGSSARHVTIVTNRPARNGGGRPGVPAGLRPEPAGRWRGGQVPGDPARGDRNPQCLRPLRWRAGYLHERARASWTHRPVELLRIRDRVPANSTLESLDGHAEGVRYLAVGESLGQHPEDRPVGFRDFAADQRDKFPHGASLGVLFSQNVLRFLRDSTVESRPAAVFRRAVDAQVIKLALDGAGVRRGVNRPSCRSDGCRL